MRKFRNIVIVIITSISALFIFNIIYLHGLFECIEEDTRRVISSCIEEADSKEMQARLDVISRHSDGNRSIVIDKAFKSDSISEKSVVQTTTRAMTNDKDTATRTYSETSELDMATFGQLLKEIRTTIHQNIDNLLPVNLHRLDSLLSIELNEKGISTNIYYIEIVNQKTGDIIDSSFRNSIKSDNSFVYVFDQENRYAYQIYMASLTGTVFQQMAGVLISTFLIILLLGGIFWYFIHTVMQQKTLEEMKDDFTNNMTHELKTPIAVAYSAADTLLNFRQGEIREKRQKYLQVCIEQLTHLSGLVEQILSMSMERRKSLTMNKEYLELNSMLNQQIELHKLKSTKDVKFQLNIEPDDLTVYADNVHLNNVISNLLDNAIKYSKGNPDIEILARQEGEYSVISIKDNGIGISASSIEHIFKKFYRVPKGNLHNVKGYGLGLFYVKQIIERHGGNINVKSISNKGSIFTIKIPVK
ncbi:Adaptive-response sensory-kinase SasA [Bacteroides pyogenes]|uniref:histidine kinase n=2 Tax=Bacteroides pyogenes TaxID=310300 RepID=W4PK79_9BACE|nr:HAMP domain-containing sensor histidine kinase [Bacteroides pyogenes]GAE16822.1 osmosensitive K+ channel histidine kinase KdpD [Bacteroides pyogenes JCM 6292]MBR8720062.1 Adaptive-response sensory-kinase SasA [Bacteroides pyogenes]MBR8726576.1 Adaptive-response sensory-kinase SasA [Bacteroides pyogenes]MBR8739958.1 Adaptive-response sensory-kinase SasA [Bacteroides pyogenes]MBR8755722.1 Adaptive-response sensory-kinase SasA [Bacteroides pyogenes]